MSTFLAQLKQWPPTDSTIYGGAILLGLLSYIATGSFELALGIAGIIKVLCPQDAAAVDRGIQEAREIATTPKANP